jgi:hypothetical protein
MNTTIESLKPTLAELQRLYAELSALENDLRDAGENLEAVQLQKKMTWADMQARNLVAGPAEQLFYKIKNALTPEILNGLAGEILDCKCTREEAAELMDTYRQRAEYFAANARAIQNN